MVKFRLNLAGMFLCFGMSPRHSHSCANMYVTWRMDVPHSLHSYNWGEKEPREERYEMKMHFWFLISLIFFLARLQRPSMPTSWCGTQTRGRKWPPLMAVHWLWCRWHSPHQATIFLLCQGIALGHSTPVKVKLLRGKQLALNKQGLGDIV